MDQILKALVGIVRLATFMGCVLNTFRTFRKNLWFNYYTLFLTFMVAYQTTLFGPKEDIWRFIGGIIGCMAHIGCMFYTANKLSHYYYMIQGCNSLVLLLGFVYMFKLTDDLRARIIVILSLASTVGVPTIGAYLGIWAPKVPGMGLGFCTLIVIASGFDFPAKATNTMIWRMIAVIIIVIFLICSIHSWRKRNLIESQLPSTPQPQVPLTSEERNQTYVVAETRGEDMSGTQVQSLPLSLTEIEVVVE